MDSRNDVYGEALYNEYMGAIINRQGELPAYVAKWDPDFFLVTYGSDRSPAFHAWLRQSPEWRLVYFDDRQLVYLRARPRFAEILARDAFSLIDPTTPVYQAMKPDRAQEWHDEAARAYRNAPGSWTARQYLAKSLMLLNRLDEAEQHLRAIAESLPWAWFAWVDIGVVNLMKGDRNAAIDAFERCLAISPQQEVCRQYLGRARGTAP